MIYITINYIFAKSYFNLFLILPHVSKSWTKQFLDYNPQFYKKKQKLLIVENKNTYNKKDFQDYFEKYMDIYIEKKIMDKDI